jgi:hypothetical protein
MDGTRIEHTNIPNLDETIGTDRRKAFAVGEGSEVQYVGGVSMEYGTNESYRGVVWADNIVNGKGTLVIARNQQGIIGGEGKSPYRLGMAKEPLDASVASIAVVIGSTAVQIDGAVLPSHGQCIRRSAPNQRRWDRRTGAQLVVDGAPLDGRLVFVSCSIPLSRVEPNSGGNNLDRAIQASDGNYNGRTLLGLGMRAVDRSQPNRTDGQGCTCGT